MGNKSQLFHRAVQIYLPETLLLIYLYDAMVHWIGTLGCFVVLGYLIILWRFPSSILLLIIVPLVDWWMTREIPVIGLLLALYLLVGYRNLIIKERKNLKKRIFKANWFNFKLLDYVEVNNREFMVLTEKRYLIFFKIPRVVVMPYKSKEFVEQGGIQIHLNTSNRDVLTEWHEFILSLMNQGFYESIKQATRKGEFPFPTDKAYLKQYVKRLL